MQIVKQMMSIMMILVEIQFRTTKKVAINKINVIKLRTIIGLDIQNDIASY